jgi:hypothetical protein
VGVRVGTFSNHADLAAPQAMALASTNSRPSVFSKVDFCIVQTGHTGA